VNFGTAGDELADDVVLHTAVNGEDLNGVALSKDFRGGTGDLLDEVEGVRVDYVPGGDGLSVDFDLGDDRAGLADSLCEETGVETGEADDVLLRQSGIVVKGATITIERGEASKSERYG